MYELEQITCTIPHTDKQYKSGENIAYQGDKVNHLLMLTRGRVKTEIVSSSGMTLPVDEIGAPYPLAAAFLFAENNRFPVDVIALQECDVMLIPKETIEAKMRECPQYMRGFMAFNANRMQYISERLKRFAQKGIKGKIVYYILSRERDGEFKLGRSIASLAEYFGVERPSLSRAMSEMVKEGIITLLAGKGQILDFKALEKLL